MFPIGGAGFRASAGMSININIGGGGAGLSPMGGGGGCCCGGGGDGFFPSSELGAGSPGFGLSPFGPPGLNNFAAQLASNPLPDFSRFLGEQHPGFSPMGNAIPHGIMMEGGGMGGFASLLGGGGGMGDFASLLGGGGSLTSQALMLQAASSDANQAALIGAQTGSLGGLMGAQGTALAGINPLMSGLMSNYM